MNSKLSSVKQIKKIVSEGEHYARQADSHLGFGRPDIALQEYMKACIIAVDIIPRHKDYPALKSDRGELHRLHDVFLKVCQLSARSPKDGH